MTRQAKILIVDDEEVALKNLQHVMAKEGYAVTATSSGTHALTLIESEEFDVILTDLRMEKVDGMQLLEASRERKPDTEVIMITGYATAESAVEAMRRGAFYYIAKPFRLDEVRKIVSEAMGKIRMRRENLQLREQVESYQGKVRIISQDRKMQELLDLAARIAPTDCSVLITGESGTGKDLLARYIHHNSKRSDGPYVAVNCGAFSEDFLASELFGHERGAFAGAANPRKGVMETGAGGTLFLDEITELSPAMQVRLVRVMQEKEVLPAGAATPIQSDIRIIAATKRDLGEAVRIGAFRQDLYFHLNVVGMQLLPLAQREGDIALLSRYFLKKFSAQMQKEVTDISPEAMSLILNYAFPGNVRELQNIIERGTALTNTTTIEVAHLPDAVRDLGVITFRKKQGRLPTLEEQERQYIEWVLHQAGGKQTEAAQILGINRVSLWRKLKGYNGDTPQ